MVLATNPFELFLDFGLRIKARSDATLTFLVQLAGGGSYMPSARAVAGGGYSAQGNRVSSEEGQVLVDKALDMINKTLK